jgi:hypothetical protein
MTKDSGRRTVDRGRRIAISCALTACGLLLACPRSADEVGEAFEDFVAERADCEQDGDCAVIYTECPLGCYHAVNAEHAEEVEARAAELVAEYELWGRSCAYDCVQHDEPRCMGGRCEVEALEERADAGVEDGG